MGGWKKNQNRGCGVSIPKQLCKVSFSICCTSHIFYIQSLCSIGDDFLNTELVFATKLEIIDITILIDHNYLSLKGAVCQLLIQKQERKKEKSLWKLCEGTIEIQNLAMLLKKACYLIQCFLFLLIFLRKKGDW